MKFIGNLIWFAIYGVWFAAFHFLLGIALCVTLVGIPFGIQNIKIARFVIWPFGRTAFTDFDRHAMSNFIWAIFGGVLLAFVHVTVGVLLCMTLIGIPFAKKCFNLALLSLTPFGATVN